MKSYYILYLFRKYELTKRGEKRNPLLSFTCIAICFCMLLLTIFDINICFDIANSFANDLATCLAKK